MKNKFKATVLYNKDLIKTLETVESTLVKVTNPALEEMVKLVGDEDTIVSSVLFAPLKMKNDGELFNKLLLINKKYLEIIPELKTTVGEELPDTMIANTNDINIRLALAIIAQGVFLGIELIPTLSATIANRYIKDSKSVLDSSIDVVKQNNLTNIVNILTKLEEADFKKTVSIIGSVPVLKTVRNEKRSIIPVEVVSDNIASTFNISGITLSYITDLFSFSIGDKPEIMYESSFVGNPIMHIRLFILDMEVLYLDKLKEESKLLELRILELKNQQMERNDPKLARAIEKYEDKVNKLNLKINRILKSE